MKFDSYPLHLGQIGFSDWILDFYISFFQFARSNTIQFMWKILEVCFSFFEFARVKTIQFMWKSIENVDYFLVLL